MAEEPLRNFAIEADGAFAGGIGMKLQTDVDRISAEHATPFHWNAASARALEKAGFQKEGVMRRAAIKDGRIADVPLYARLKSP